MPSRYGYLHKRIHDWIDEGELHFSGKKSREEEYVALDVKILELFGYPVGRKGCHRTYRSHTIQVVAGAMSDDIHFGKLDIDWIYTANGLALFKALLAQRGYTPDSDGRWHLDQPTPLKTPIAHETLKP